MAARDVPHCTSVPGRPSTSGTRRQSVPAWIGLRSARSACYTQSDVGTVTQPSRLKSMDRIYLAIIASAILLVLGVAGPVVIRTADLMPHARTVSAAQLR